MTNQIEQMKIFRGLKLSHNFLHCRTVFENVTQNSFGMRPLSHTQKCVDKPLGHIYLYYMSIFEYSSRFTMDAPNQAYEYAYLNGGYFGVNCILPLSRLLGCINFTLLVRTTRMFFIHFINILTNIDYTMYLFCIILVYICTLCVVCSRGKDGRNDIRKPRRSVQL